MRDFRKRLEAAISEAELTRRSFLQKTGGAAMSALLPFRHIGLNSTTARAIVETLTGTKKLNLPIFIIAPSHCYDEVGVDEELSKVQTAWQNIAALTSSKIAGTQDEDWYFIGLIQPKRLAELLQQAARNSGKVEINGANYTIEDDFDEETNRLELQRLREYLAADRKAGKTTFIGIQKRIERLENASYDFWLEGEVHRLHVTDHGVTAGYAVEAFRDGTDTDVKQGLLRWWQNFGVFNDNPINAETANFLKELGAEPREGHSWDDKEEFIDSDEDKEVDEPEELKIIQTPEDWRWAHPMHQPVEEQKLKPVIWMC